MLTLAAGLFVKHPERLRQGHFKFRRGVIAGDVITQVSQLDVVLSGDLDILRDQHAHHSACALKCTFGLLDLIRFHS